MCKNAQAYNEEASLIHEDSIVLERVFTNARAKVEAELEAQSEPADNGERGGPSGDRGSRGVGVGSANYVGGTCLVTE